MGATDCPADLVLKNVLQCIFDVLVDVCGIDLYTRHHPGVRCVIDAGRLALERHHTVAELEPFSTELMIILQLGVKLVYQGDVALEDHHVPIVYPDGVPGILEHLAVGVVYEHVIKVLYEALHGGALGGPDIEYPVVAADIFAGVYKCVDVTGVHYKCCCL